MRKQTNVGFNNSLEISWRAANGAHKTVRPALLLFTPALQWERLTTQASVTPAPLLLHL